MSDHNKASESAAPINWTYEPPIDTLDRPNKKCAAVLDLYSSLSKERGLVEELLGDYIKTVSTDEITEGSES